MPARATAPACSGTRPTPRSRARHPLAGVQLEQRRAVVRQPPFFDPSLNAGFVTGRGSGGGVTYGDPEIGGRPPRYQNWNAGVQFALTNDMTVRRPMRGARAISSAAAAGASSPISSIPDTSRWATSSRSGHAANIAAAQAIVPGVAPPYPISTAPRPDAAALPAVQGRHRRVRQRRRVDLSLAAGDVRAPPRHGLTLNANYTFSRTEDNLAARTGYNFGPDWAAGVNDQPHILNVIVVYDLPFGSEASRAAATRSSVRW